MSTVAWLNDYDSELYNKVTALMGEGESPYYDQALLDRLQTMSVTGYYFNTVDGSVDTAPEWLPDNHRLATMILTGKIIRSATNLTNSMYEDALNGTPEGGKMHTILYFKDVVVDFQSLINLGNLNKHRAMGIQVILGSPTAGFLKAVTTFVSRFAGRNDIVQLDNGSWDDSIAQIQRLLKQEEAT